MHGPEAKPELRAWVRAQGWPWPPDERSLEAVESLAGEDPAPVPAELWVVAESLLDLLAELGPDQTPEG